MSTERNGTSSVVHDDAHTINCQDLTYSFTEGSESALTGATLQLPRGARCLLVGANGGMSSHEPKYLRQLIKLKLENQLCCVFSPARDSPKLDVVEFWAKMCS